MNSPNQSEQKSRAVFILEDDHRVLDALVDSLSESLKKAGDFYVFGCDSISDGWSAIKRAQEEGYLFFAVVVDQVKGKGRRRDPDWGIQFLRQCKDQCPNVYRIMFSGESTRTDIQRVLDQGLIHDFEAKDAAVEEELSERISSKIIKIVQGKDVGNIRSPSAEEQFRVFMENWMKTLPDKGNTEIKTLGRIFKVQELLDDPELFEDFREAFEATRLDEMTK